MAAGAAATVAVVAAFFAGAFFAGAAFLAGAFFAGAAFLAGAFFAALAGAFFAGCWGARVGGAARRCRLDPARRPWWLLLCQFRVQSRRAVGSLPIMPVGDVPVSP